MHEHGQELPPGTPPVGGAFTTTRIARVASYLSELGEKSILSAIGIQPERPILPPAEATGPSTYGLPSRPESVADRVIIARIRARAFIVSACRQSVSASERAILELQKRTRRMKNERPVAFLGFVAGSAFVLGLTLRIWRSRRS